MGRFPRLTPVRLSPQVPDHMTVSDGIKGLDGFLPAWWAADGALPGVRLHPLQGCSLGQANVGWLSPSEDLCSGGASFAGATRVRLAVSPI